MKQYKHSICLMTCCFGEALLHRAAYFLKTAGWNSTVDFVVFSDQEAPASLPANVKFVQISMADFNLLASEQLGMAIAVEQIEKLKDFRPAYGKIFANHIQGYDFWGHVDTDILLGDIREFLTAELLEETDVFTARAAFPAGYFTLYRNNSDTVDLFKQSADWQKVFSNVAYLGFDEWGLTYQAYFNRRKLPQDNTSAIVSMADVLGRENINLRVVRQPVSHELGFRELLEVNKEGVQRLGKEGRFMVIYFDVLNKQPSHVYEEIKAGDEQFYIDVFGLLSCSSDTKLTVAERDRQILEKSYAINFENVRINDGGEVSIYVDNNEWFDVSKYILINTQFLLLINETKETTGNQIVDFFVASQLFSIQKQVPPTRNDIELVLLNILCGLVEFGHLTILK